MSQDDFGNIDPNATSGVDLANLLEAQRDADHSNHIGNARPSYVVPGMLWLDDNVTPWVINFFDGSNDLPIAQMDPVAHKLRIVDKGVLLADVATTGDFADLIGIPSSGLVLISGADTTPGDLFAKFKQGGGFTLTINNPGGNEELEINYDFASQAEAETGSDQIKPMNSLRTAQAIASQASLPGSVEDFAGASVPLGYLECDGQAVNRVTFAVLFTAIGTIWGVGDGSTTFNVPDLQRITTIGAGGTGTATIGNTVGDTGGEEDHQLVIAEHANHGHPYRVTPTGSASQVPDSSGGFVMENDSARANRAAFTGTPNDANQIGGSGGDQAHNTIQPSAVMLKIIKT